MLDFMHVHMHTRVKDMWWESVDDTLGSTRELRTTRHSSFASFAMHVLGLVTWVYANALFVSLASCPDRTLQDYGAGPTAVTAAPNAHDAVVESLRSKLRAADVRERELHQHLLFHMKGTWPAWVRPPLPFRYSAMCCRCGMCAHGLHVGRCSVAFLWQGAQSAVSSGTQEGGARVLARTIEAQASWRLGPVRGRVWDCSAATSMWSNVSLVLRHRMWSLRKGVHSIRAGLSWGSVTNVKAARTKEQQEAHTNLADSSSFSTEKSDFGFWVCAVRHPGEITRVFTSCGTSVTLPAADAHPPVASVPVDLLGFGLPEKDSLVEQVAELQRVCEALLLSQMQVRNTTMTDHAL